MALNSETETRPAAAILATLTPEKQAELAALRWDEPYNLFGEALWKRRPLTRAMLPSVIADYAFDAAERLGVEPAMIVAPMLAACAGCITDEQRIQPREHDSGWTEAARLWIATIAPVAGKKSPAQRVAFAPVRELDLEIERENARARQQQEMVEANAKLHKDAKPAQEAMVSPACLTDIWTGEPIAARETQRRLYFNNVTIESLGPILVHNPQGLLGIYDELTELFGSFDAYRSGGALSKDRPAWLQLYEGGPYRIDRIKRGSLTVPNWSATLFGSIQTEKLAELAPRLAVDGMLQRFVLMIGRDTGEGIDRPPDAAAEKAYADLIAALAYYEPWPGHKTVKLAPEAQQHREHVHAAVEIWKNHPHSPTALVAHLNKWEAMFARLLLTFHVIQDRATAKPEDGYLTCTVAEIIPETTAKMAADFMLGVVLPETLAFYTEIVGTSPEIEDARRIGRLALAKGLTVLSEREIMRGCHEFEAEGRDRIAPALILLGYMNWVAPMAPNRSGYAQWAVSPLAHLRFAEERDAEQERRLRAVEAIKAAAALRVA